MYIGYNAPNNHTTNPIKVQHGNRSAVLSVFGTFAGATVTVAQSLDGGQSWIDLLDGVFTLPGQRIFPFVHGWMLNARVTGGNAATKVTIDIS